MRFLDPLEYLSRKAVQSCPRGQTIYASQFPAHHLYVVIRGRVKITNIATDRCETVARIVGSDGIFGESCLLADAPRPETAVAMDEVCLMAWTRAEVEAQIEREPRLGLALCQHLALKCMQLQNRIESMTAFKTPERTMLALMNLAVDLGTETTPDGAVRVKSLTHHTIAEYVGTSREVITFQMNRLRRAGMLKYNRRHIDVYLAAIRGELLRQHVVLPREISAFGGQ